MFDQEAVANIERLLTSLDDVQDKAFDVSRALKQKRASRLTEEILDNVQAALHAAEARNRGEPLSPHARAKYAYWRGRAMMSSSEFESQAEVHIRRALELDPQLFEAWTQFGYLKWKKNDLKSARSHFETSVGIIKSKRALGFLSMLLRQLECSDESERKSNVERGLVLAKQLVGLDLKDGHSWFVYGNALMANYFKVSHTSEDVQRCMTAYQQALHNGEQWNPDLFYNKAELLNHLQEYNAAGQCYSLALEKDPHFNVCRERLESMKAFVMHVHKTIRTKDRLRRKQLADMVADLRGALHSIPSVYTPSAVTSLREGHNRERAVACHMVTSVSKGTANPITIVAVDRETNFFGVSIYGVTAEFLQSLSKKDVLLISRPFLKTVSLHTIKNAFRYPCLIVSDLSCLTVNGRPLDLAHAASAHIRFENFNIASPPPPPRVKTPEKTDGTASASAEGPRKRVSRSPPAQAESSKKVHSTSASATSPTASSPPPPPPRAKTPIGLTATGSKIPRGASRSPHAQAATTPQASSPPPRPPPPPRATAPKNANQSTTSPLASAAQVEPSVPLCDDVKSDDIVSSSNLRGDCDTRSTSDEVAMEHAHCVMSRERGTPVQKASSKSTSLPLCKKDFASPRKAPSDVGVTRESFDSLRTTEEQPLQENVPPTKHVVAGNEEGLSSQKQLDAPTSKSFSGNCKDPSNLSEVETPIQSATDPSRDTSLPHAIALAPASPTLRSLQAPMGAHVPPAKGDGSKQPLSTDASHLPGLSAARSTNKHIRN